MNPKITGIIPARYGSTRFPGKPLHPIGGKPLIQHVWERACRAKELDSVIVATDDMRIAECAFAFGAEISVTSPSHPTGTDRITEVARKLRSTTHVINIQGDEPLVDPRLINRLAVALRKDRDLEMITAANPISDPQEAASPHVVKVVVDLDGNALYFSRSTIPFDRAGKGVRLLRHHGIYGYTRDFLLRFVRWKPTPLEQAEQLEQLRALERGVRIRVLETHHPSVGIDTPADADALEARLASRA